MATNGSQNIRTGATGTVLQGQGVGTAPAFSTATYPSATVGSGKILYDNGTNFVTSTPTFPTSASATTRKIIVSDGTNWVASTETYATPGTSGNVMTSDGTNWTSAAPSPGGGGMPSLTYISNATASSSASLAFTSLSASTYRGYRFYLVQLVPATSGSFPQIQVSTNNGSTYISTANYVNMINTLSGTTLSTTGTAAGAAQVDFVGAGSTTVSISGIVDMYYQGNANNLVTFQATVQQSTKVFCTVAFYGAQANVNAIKFFENSGNITSGTIYMYGIT